jgi:hypothetical protein
MCIFGKSISEQQRSEYGLKKVRQLQALHLVFPIKFCILFCIALFTPILFFKTSIKHGIGPSPCNIQDLS